MARKIYNSNHMISKQWKNGTGSGGSTVKSGSIVVMGNVGNATLGIALVDILDGDTGAVGFNCGVLAKKVPATTYNDGESLRWDISALSFINNTATPIPESGDVSGSCRADEPGVDTKSEARIWLTGIPGTLTA